MASGNEVQLGNGGRYKHHKYTWSKPFGSARHCWEVVGAKGAIHFHATFFSNYGVSCGLEIHSLIAKGAPDHIDCPLTGGRCWHDGTSLYAQEHLWPVIELYLCKGEHDKIFLMLEREANERFEAESSK